MVGFDTETTGVSPTSDRIVTAALIRREGSLVQTLTWVIDPGVEIPERATAVHGITTAFAREHGFTRTLFGRKTHFPNIRSSQMNLRQGSERAAINAPIQGTSADIIKRAMVRMMPALEAAGLGHVRMLLQVHDELVFELPESDTAAASNVIEAVMAGAAGPAVELSVPLGVEIGTGHSWGAAH